MLPCVMKWLNGTRSHVSRTNVKISLGFFEGMNPSLGTLPHSCLLRPQVRSSGVQAENHTGLGSNPGSTRTPLFGLEEVLNLSEPWLLPL